MGRSFRITFTNKASMIRRDFPSLKIMSRQRLQVASNKQCQRSMDHTFFFFKVNWSKRTFDQQWAIHSGITTRSSQSQGWGHAFFYPIYTSCTIFWLCIRNQLVRYEVMGVAGYCFGRFLSLLNLKSTSYILTKGAVIQSTHSQTKSKIVLYMA